MPFQTNKIKTQLILLIILSTKILPCPLGEDPKAGGPTGPDVDSSIPIVKPLYDTVTVKVLVLFIQH